jgi:Resolvase, N terminal domain
VPHNYGYLLPIPRRWPDGSALGLAQSLQEFCAYPGWELAGLFADGWESWAVPWLERPAGRELDSRLQSGDRVVVASGACVWTGARDMLPIVRAWRARGITLWILPELPRGLCLTTEGALGPVVEASLALWIDIDRRLRSTAVREGLAERRQRGVRYCHHPAYGFRWEGPEGQERLVADEGEQRALAQIAEERRAGATWAEVEAALDAAGLRTAEGKRWSRWRARRAYLRVTAPPEGERVNNPGSSG